MSAGQATQSPGNQILNLSWLWTEWFLSLACLRFSDPSLDPMKMTPTWVEVKVVTREGSRIREAWFWEDELIMRDYKAEQWRAESGSPAFWSAVISCGIMDMWSQYPKSLSFPHLFNENNSTGFGVLMKINWDISFTFLSLAFLMEVQKKMAFLLIFLRRSEKTVHRENAGEHCWLERMAGCAGLKGKILGVKKESFKLRRG